MLNGYYDLDLGPFKPYVGLGAGLAKAKFKQTVLGLSGSDSDTVVAYQFMGGLAFEITPAANIFAVYRYFSTLE